jgi:hypothetical protein
MTNWVSVVLALLASAAGLWAANLWHEITKIRPDMTRYAGMTDPSLKTISECHEALNAFLAIGEIAHRAAKWTAGAVVLGALAMLTSAWG